MLLLTLLLLYSSTTFFSVQAHTNPSDNQLSSSSKTADKNTKKSTLERITPEKPQDVLVFHGIRLAEYEEQIRIGIPFTTELHNLKRYINLINNQITRVNRFDGNTRKQYAKLLVNSYCNGSPCMNHGFCFRIGKNDNKKRCACRQRPNKEGNRVLIYYGQHCKQSMYINRDIHDRRSAAGIMTDEKYTYWNLEEVKEIFGL